MTFLQYYEYVIDYFRTYLNECSSNYGKKRMIEHFKKKSQTQQKIKLTHSLPTKAMHKS